MFEGGETESMQMSVEKTAPEVDGGGLDKISIALKSQMPALRWKAAVEFG